MATTTNDNENKRHKSRKSEYKNHTRRQNGAHGFNKRIKTTKILTWLKTKYFKDLVAVVAVKRQSSKLQ